MLEGQQAMQRCSLLGGAMQAAACLAASPPQALTLPVASSWWVMSFRWSSSSQACAGWMEETQKGGAQGERWEWEERPALSPWRLCVWWQQAQAGHTRAGHKQAGHTWQVGAARASPAKAVPLAGRLACSHLLVVRLAPLLRPLALLLKKGVRLLQGGRALGTPAFQVF